MSNQQFTPVTTRDNEIGGWQKIYRFPNGFGASVVCGPYTYGGSEGLREFAVLKFDDLESADWEITYDTEITSGVIGYLSDEAVDALLNRIAALEPVPS